MLRFIHLEVEFFQLDLTVEKLELFSTPYICITLHNALLKATYSSQDSFSLECQGKLTLQLHLHKKNCKYSFKGELFLPTQTNKGMLCFDNYNDFTLENLIEGFGWATDKAKSIPILSTALTTAVRRVHIEFNSSTTNSLQISSLFVILHLEKLDIGILQLNHIQLSVKIVRHENEEFGFKTYFNLQALINEKLFVELEYDPDNHLLDGSVTVCDFNSVNATDGLGVFKLDESDSSSQSFSNMNMVLQDCFMSVFESTVNEQKEGTGLVACMKLSIRVPSKNHNKYSLEYIGLQVKDCLCIQNCILDTIEFIYSKTSPSTSEAHLIAILKSRYTKESMKITFDLTATSEKPTVLSAKIEPNGDKSLSLCSIFKLVCCVKPDLPKVDIPPIFDLHILSGSVSLELSPFQVCQYDVSVTIPKWQIFDDPNFLVQDLKIRAVWESGMKMPNLTFDNCTLIFQSWKLDISGKLMPEVVSIQCTSNLLPPDDTIQFESFLQKYTPESVACPTIPTDIYLPPLTVSTIRLGVELKENVKTFSLTSTISSVWKFNFGDRHVQVNEISGSLEWVKQNNDASRYQAVLYGFFDLGLISVSASMRLGYNVDSVLVATVSNVHYGQIADYLTSQPFDSSLVPQNVQGIKSFAASLAFNVTKKHFFLSGSVENWGKCTLLVAYVHDQDDMDYMFMISIGDNFRFSQLSDSLAFVDGYITVKSANLLVSSVDLDKLECIMKPFEEVSSQDMSKIHNPFITIPKFCDSKLVKNEVKKGATLYAVLNVHSCRGSKGTIGNLFLLGDKNLEQNDIIMKVFIKIFSGFISNIEVFAYIPSICLFGMLEFSMIEMSYQIIWKNKDASPQYFLELSGRVTVGLDLDVNHERSISFDGKLHITTTDAKFEASSENMIDKPAGINITVEKLSLKLRFDLCKDKSKVPDVMIFGQISISNFIMECMLILKGISFKVLEIKLKSGLTLNALFTCSNINWAPSTLTIHIKDGKFYYAKEDVSIDNNNQLIHYKKGFFLTCVIVLFDWDFRIEAQAPPDRSKLSLSGRSVKKIDLGFAKLTGTDAYIHEGPEIRYYDNKLSLTVGVELFNQPYFEGCLSYLFHEKALEGTICYLGSILWIKNPKVTVRWSKENGFQIIEFPMPGSPFDLLGAIAKYALVLYKLISGIFSWGITLELRTGKNPDPNKYLVKLILGGTINVTIAGFITAKIIPLPDIPLRILKMTNFTLAKLPQYILKCLWESAGDICKSLLCYINPINLAWQMGKMIVGAVVTTIKTVVNVVKNVAKKAWGFCKRLFGFSAFLIDSDQNTILGYIYAGKDGRKLHNLQYTVDNFGEFLVAHTIEKIAKDIHTNATACVQVEGTNNYTNELNELEKVTHSLSYELNLAADDVLAVKFITVDYCGGLLCIKWQVGNSDSEGKIYSEDTGDIEYHIKVIAILAQVSTHAASQVHIEKIHDDTVTPDYPKKDDLESRALAMYEKQKSKVSDSIISQHQGEQQCEEEMKTNESAHVEETCYRTEMDAGMLSVNIPIDHALVEQALCILVSIKPTVTLRIKTLPPEKPRVADEQMLQSEDKHWMQDIKDEINKLGREKEVTLIGKTGYFRHFLKSLSAKSELIINASFEYSEKTKILNVKGKIKVMPEASFYLIQVTDTSDETIVIKSELISPTSPLHHYDGDSHSNKDDHDNDDSISSYSSENEASDDMERDTQEDDSIDFSFDVTLAEFPDDSPGPYTITCFALTEALEFLQIVTVPHAKINRCKSPVNIDIRLPNMVSDQSPEVVLKWEPGINQDEHIFEVEISIACTKQNLEKEIRDIDIGNDFLLEESERTFTHSLTAFKKIDNEDTNKVSYMCKFDLVSLFNNNKIPLQTGAVVKCQIFGVSTLSTSLPSLPVSKKFIIVASPPKVEIRFNEVIRSNPGLKLSWIHTMHAVSYQTEYVNKLTKHIKHHKAYQFDKETTKDFNADAVLDIDDVKALLCEDGLTRYRLQMFSLGFGQDLIRSLVPTVAQEEVVISSVDIEYISTKEMILVKFIPFTPYPVTTYEIALYQCNRVYSLLTKQTIQVKCRYNSVVQCEFHSNLWKHCVRTGYGIAAYVHALKVDMDGTFYLGASANDLLFLSPPQNIMTKVHYKDDWLVDCIDINWPSALHTSCYQIGFQSMHGNSIVWSRKVFGNEATIYNSELYTLKVSSATCKCFVVSIGYGYLITSCTACTVDDVECYQFITGTNNKTLVFTSVSLLAMQNLSIDLTKMCWKLNFRQCVLPKGHVFPCEYFSSRKFEKFWEKHRYDCQGII